MSFVVPLGIVGSSFGLKNFIVPLELEMTLVIIGWIALWAPEVIYFPYSYNILSINLGDNGPLILVVFNITVSSLICFIVASVLGYLDVK
mgnify:CR=1 FL=1